MTDDWWQSAPLAPASDPSFSGYIPGSPKPKDVTTWSTLNREQAIAAGLDPSFTWQRSSAGETKKVGDAGDPQKDMLGDAIKGLGVEELISNVKKARSAVDGGYATGMTGAVLSRIPGTSAADFRGYIDAIQGGIILEKMQALKDASKTGASGLGALSEKEGDRLAASVAAIKPNMSDKALKDSFAAIEQHANFLKAVSEGKDPRDPNVAKTYGIGNVPAAPPASGNTDVLFEDEAPPGTTGAQELHDQISTALSQKRIKSYDDLAALVGAFNAANNTGFPPPPNNDETRRAIKSALEGKKFGVTLPADSNIRNRIVQEDKLGVGESSVEALANQGSQLNLSDEASGVGNAVANVLTSPVTGNFDPVFSYKFGRDVERQRIEDARQQLGYGGTAVEFLSAAASGNPTAALSTFAPKAAAIAAGKAGAAGGALAGFGAGEGAEESAAGLGTGALAGYALGRYAPAAVESILPRRFRAAQGMAPDVAEAAKAENVDLIRPMVDPSAISDYGALESNVYSQPIIRGAAARVRGQVEDRAAALGQGGQVLEEGAAGERLQVASNRYITRSRGIKDRLYKRAENLGGDTRFVPEKALGQIDNEIAQLIGNPETNGAEIAFLQKVRDDLSKGGGKTVAEIRNIREGLRGEIGRSNLTLSGAETRALRVMDAAADDVADKVPQAASAYRRADTFYRERMVMVDDIKRAILGRKNDPLDPQKAFANIKSLASPGANGRRLSAIMRHLEPDERQDIAATVAQSLGRRAADEPFSTALFLSQTRKLSPSARRTIFGPDGAQSIDNLRLLSRKLEEAEKDINRSRSATVLERQGWRSPARAVISGLAGIGGTAATGSMAGGAAALTVAGGAMAGTAVRKVLSARAMVNPRVSRWLAEAADVSTPTQAKDATRKLGVIIAREPAIANELQPVYDMLKSRLDLPLAAGTQSEAESDD